jgi:hypothetical protein
MIISYCLSMLVSVLSSFMVYMLGITYRGTYQQVTVL